MEKIPVIDQFETAVLKLHSQLHAIEDELIPVDDALGRVLSQPILADRDSPACNVSAMDGYAVRLADLRSPAASGSLASGRFPVSGTAFAGRPVMTLPAGAAMQIFTGGCVPTGADCVIRREDILENLPADPTPSEHVNSLAANYVEIIVPLESLKTGQNIRFQGENIQRGQTVLTAGTSITPANIGALATFGEPNIRVRRKLKVAICTTGDELIAAGQPVQPWQIRDSNGPTLLAWLAGLPWCDLVGRYNLKDEFASVCQTFDQISRHCDVVIATGGVSAGDTDFVPRAIDHLAGKVHFHGLPIRPGKPVLAATLGRTLFWGLPGNPVSTAVTARVLVQPAMERLVAKTPPSEFEIELCEADDKTLPLMWYRLIQQTAQGARLLSSRGSGDLVSMAHSHGFVQIPPGKHGPGPWKCWLW